jgi:hypothetical protein
MGHIRFKLPDQWNHPGNSQEHEREHLERGAVIRSLPEGKKSADGKMFQGLFPRGKGVPAGCQHDHIMIPFGIPFRKEF